MPPVTQPVPDQIMNKISPRLLLTLIGLSALGLLAMALYSQHVGHMLPCPLCVLQRYAFACIALFALTGASRADADHTRRPSAVRQASTGLGLLAALAGGGVAVYQVWLMAHPSFSCGIDPMETSLNTIITARWLPWIFKADGLCSTEYPPLLGLSFPQWALVWFVIYALAHIYLLARRRK
jgi:disulfide bond formation protein DsbB